MAGTRPALRMRGERKTELLGRRAEDDTAGVAGLGRVHIERRADRAAFGLLLALPATMVAAWAPTWPLAVMLFGVSILFSLLYLAPFFVLGAASCPIAARILPRAAPGSIPVS
jgi:hypothetical protein